jgi:hypothetical protein
VRDLRGGYIRGWQLTACRVVYCFGGMSFDLICGMEGASDVRCGMFAVGTFLAYRVIIGMLVFLVGMRFGRFGR